MKKKQRKEAKQINNSKALIPHLITALRVVLALIFLYLFFTELIALTISIFLIACFTDIFDGVAARKFDVSSSFGAYLDAIADCLLILTAFSIFVFVGFYPFWILILIGFMFVQFLLTSKLKQPIYDPIGRYCGVFFFIVISDNDNSSSPII